MTGGARRPPSRGRAALRWAARGALLLAMLAALVFLVRRIGIRTLLATARQADLRWVAAAVAVKLLSNGCAVLRLRRLALAFTPLSRWRAAAIVCASYATNHLFGAGFATAYRAFGLARAGASAAAGLTAVALEKYLELLTFVLAVMPLALLLGAPPQLRWAFWLWVGAATASALVVLVALLVARHGRRGRLARMAAGLAALRRAGHLPAALGLTVLLLAFELLLLYCAARAVGAPVGLEGALFALLGAQIAFMIPGPPSSVGAVEAGVVVTLEAVGVSPQTALAAALLYHAVHLVVELPTGLPPLRSAAWRPWRPPPEAADEGGQATPGPGSA